MWYLAYPEDINKLPDTRTFKPYRTKKCALAAFRSLNSQPGVYRALLYKGTPMIDPRELLPIHELTFGPRGGVRIDWSE